MSSNHRSKKNPKQFANENRRHTAASGRYEDQGISTIKSQKSMEFPGDYTCLDLRNVFQRLTTVNYSIQESQSGSTIRQSRCTDVTGNKRSEALYHDFRDRQIRQEIVEKVVNKKAKKKLTKAVDMNAKSRRLAYQKLEKDIDKAI